MFCFVFIQLLLLLLLLPLTCVALQMRRWRCCCCIFYVDVHKPKKKKCIKKQPKKNCLRFTVYYDNLYFVVVVSFRYFQCELSVVSQRTKATAAFPTQFSCQQFLSHWMTNWHDGHAWSMLGAALKDWSYWLLFCIIKSLKAATVARGNPVIVIVLKGFRSSWMTNRTVLLCCRVVLGLTFTVAWSRRKGAAYSVAVRLKIETDVQ